MILGKQCIIEEDHRRAVRVSGKHCRLGTVSRDANKRWALMTGIESDRFSAATEEIQGSIAKYFKKSSGIGYLETPGLVLRLDSKTEKQIPLLGRVLAATVKLAAIHSKEQSICNLHTANCPCCKNIYGALE